MAQKTLNELQTDLAVLEERLERLTESAARGNLIVNTFILQPFTSKTLFPCNCAIPITWQRNGKKR